MSERGRLFVAVIPPANVLDVLATIPREARPDVRYTTRDQWHVTLRFLGDADIGEASAALQRVDVPAVEAVLGPRVERLGRSVAMVPCAGLDEVAAAVRRATAGIEHPIDARTVRRPPDDRSDEDRACGVPRRASRWRRRSR